jgi:hypothetical protein
MVIDASGDEFAAWSCENVQSSAVITQETMLPAGGSWSTPVTLSTDSNFPLSIGIDGNGNGLVAWQEFSSDRSYSQIEAAVIAPDGSVTSQTTLSQSNLSSYYPTVAVNAGGDAVVAWMGWNGTDATATQAAPFTAIGSLSGGFQSPVALDSYGVRLDDSAFGAVMLAVDAGGDAAAAWCRDGGHCSSAISQSGGAFSSAAGFPSDGGHVDDEPMIAMDPKGNITIAWLLYGGSSGSSAVYAAQEPLTGGFTAAQQISPSGDLQVAGMASDISGDAVVVWNDLGASGLPVEAATLQAGASSFQPWFQIGSEGNFGNNISASVDANGIATVTWIDQTVSCGCPPNPPTYSASFSTAAPTAAGPMVPIGSPLVSGSSSRPVVVSRLPAAATVPDSAGGPAGSIGVIWASPKNTQQVVSASTGKQLAYQPDAQVKRGSDKSYLGLGVFNTTGSQQTRSTSERVGQSATFDLKLVNAVLRSDTLSLTGCASSPGFTVRYLRGSTDVTAEVTAGTYTTGTLAPAASQKLKLTIAVSPTASVGTTDTCQLTASSVTQPKRKDLVKAKVKVAAG